MLLCWCTYLVSPEFIEVHRLNCRWHWRDSCNWCHPHSITQWDVKLYSDYGEQKLPSTNSGGGLYINESIRIQTIQALQNWYGMLYIMNRHLWTKRDPGISQCQVPICSCSCSPAWPYLIHWKLGRKYHKLVCNYYLAIVEHMDFCIIITMLDQTVGFQIWKFINYSAGNCMYYGACSCVLLYVKLKRKWSAPALTKYKHTAAIRTTRPFTQPFIHEEYWEFQAMQIVST